MRSSPPARPAAQHARVANKEEWMGNQVQAAPLAGIKVIEVGVAMAGPFCGMTLGDYGADVVKIERVGEGDETRHWPPYFPGHVGYYFAAANRNKRSLAIDLKQPEGIEILRQLAAGADVLVDNFRVGARSELAQDFYAFGLFQVDSQ